MNITFAKKENKFNDSCEYQYQKLHTIKKQVGNKSGGKGIYFSDYDNILDIHDFCVHALAKNQL